MHSNKAGIVHGSHSHRRRQQAQRHHCDFRGEERRAAADDRGAVDRTDPGARQRAAARRRRAIAAHSRQSRRRHHVGGQTARRSRLSGPDPAHFGSQHHRHHRALRAGVADARELLGDRAAAGADASGEGVAARRLRHRHAAGRSADHGAREAWRRHRHRRRLCDRDRTRRSQGRQHRFSQGDGERHPCRADGSDTCQRHHRDHQRRPRAGNCRCRRLPEQDGGAGLRRRNFPHRRRRREPSSTARGTPCCPIGSRPAPMRWRWR